jgi:N-sulfoglucosamine sulfohydrolase
MGEVILDRNSGNNSIACRNKRPNVVVIVPHDLGDYLGCYGHNVSTPNVDRLAQEGVRFTNHFCTSPLCSPARGSIITGKYPHTNGLIGLVNLGWDMPKYNITDAQLFADAGYQTYLVGFQHEMKSADNLGFHSSILTYILATNFSTDIVAEKTELLLQKIAETEEAVIGDNRRPFYIRIGMFDVHRYISPLGGHYGYDWSHDRGIKESEVEILPQWKDTPGLRYDLAGFTGSVNNLDRGVGAIINALKKHGFADDTIVIFTADHGIDFPCGKATLYDLGIRTALIMWYPGRFKGGVAVDALTSHIDILPTMLDSCSIGQTLGIQGTSLIPLIEGKSSTVHEDIFAEESTYPKNIMRCIRTKQLKLIRNYSTGGKSNAGATGQSRTVEDTGQFYFIDRPEFELYDLANDPHELNNLADNADYQTVGSELKRRLERWMQETSDPVLVGGINRPTDEYEILTKLPDFYQSVHSQLLWK